MCFLIRFEDEIYIDRMPLPNTMNKYLNFGFIPQKSFKERFKEIEGRNLYANELIHCNPRFIEVIEDFKRFIPEVVELESNKLKGSFVKAKKLGGVVNLGEMEFMLRIVLNYDRKVSFQIGIEQNGNKVMRNIAEDIIDTYCFLFGNI